MLHFLKHIRKMKILSCEATCVLTCDGHEQDCKLAIDTTVLIDRILVFHRHTHKTEEMHTLP